MLCAGWVHRDISSDNILAYEKTDGVLRAKLSDLEYARKFPRDDGKVAGDPKTVFFSIRHIVSFSFDRQGTPYFMALEIMDLIYLADPPRQPIVRNTFQVISTATVHPTRPAVVHNFQHDLEPLWWIFLWTITDRVEHEPSIEYARTIFSGSMTASIARRAALLKPLELEWILKDSLVILADYVDTMRQDLLDHYKDRYGVDKLNDPCNYVGIHSVFEGFLASLAALSTGSAWVSEPLIKSKVALAAPAPTTTDHSIAIADAAANMESAHSKERPKQTRHLSPQHAIRPIPSREPIHTRTYSKLSSSENLPRTDGQSGLRSSKRLKTRK